MKKSIFLIFLLLTSFVSTCFAKSIVLDVRTPEEYSKGHIDNATNVDVRNTNFRNEISKFSRDDDYKVYCASGRRASQAVSIMQELGFKHLENLGSLENAQRVLGQKSVPQ